jgi:zinc transporter ZupT
MSEPTTTAAGGVAGYKLALITLPVVASLIAFWLGLRYVPLRADEPQRDLVDRVTACIVSSFVFGVAALVALVDHWPQAFTAAETLAVHARLPAVAGFFLLSGCVFVVCSIPGPWIVAAVFRWLEHRREKDIAELATDVVADVRGAIAGKDGAR